MVNRQNFTDVYVQWPKKYWASNNAKTFYTDSRNKNTWYMQPAAVLKPGLTDDVKAIVISSVGWDHDGEAIPDYVQLPGESLPYSNNVPAVAHRSAGRLFIGGYDYDPSTGSEVYTEGVNFSSRPSALNGYFKFLPDITHTDDKAFVEVRLTNISDGVETVIAHGSITFDTAPDYRTFSVPLTYTYFNRPASRLYVMFSSSVAAGSQEYEDDNVPVTAYPELGVMRGSSLWVSGLTFSY